MSKNRKKRNKRHSQKPNAAATSDLVAVNYPFSTLPRESLIKGLIELGKIHQEEFSTTLTEIEELIRSIDPLHALSTLSVYGLFGSIDDKGNISKGYLGEKFNQSHVELIQALILRTPAATQLPPPAEPGAIQKLFDLLPVVAESFHLQRLVQMGKEQSQDKKAILLVQEELRMHTQGVRNWGFFSRVISVIKRLCKPIDQLFESKIGLTATQLTDLFHHLLRRKEMIVNTRLDKLRPVFSEKTVPEMIAAYYKANPHFEDSQDVFIRFSEERAMTIDQIKSLVLSHSDLSLPDVFTFTAEELAAETGLTSISITRALNQLSMRFGDTAERKVEYLFLDNPVWTKPIIDLGDGQYFCALPQLFFSFSFQILKGLIEGNAHAKEIWEKRRAAFLEDDIRFLFKNSFPGSQLACGYKWREGTTEYENDLLVKIVSHLILVEAKSHSISWPALRGAADRAKRHVAEVLLEPSIQSLRLANRIGEAQNDVSSREALLPCFPFALDEIRTVLRLSVTLEDFATLQTTLHRTRDAGWIPIDHPIAPCVLLADLEIVFDILESTPHKIHYLKRRADLEDHMSYVSDQPTTPCSALMFHGSSARTCSGVVAAGKAVKTALRYR